LAFKGNQLLRGYGDVQPPPLTGLGEDEQKEEDSRVHNTGVLAVMRPGAIYWYTEYPGRPGRAVSDPPYKVEEIVCNSVSLHDIVSAKEKSLTTEEETRINADGKGGTKEGAPPGPGDGAGGRRGSWTRQGSKSRRGSLGLVVAGAGTEADPGAGDSVV